MNKFLSLLIAFTIMLNSCQITSDEINIKPNISSEDFIKESNRYQISNVETLNLSNVDFGIKYEAKGVDRLSANCIIQILKIENEYLIRSIEISRNKEFSKTFTHNIKERILQKEEFEKLILKFKECENIPSYIPNINSCMHDTFYTIQFKENKNHWMTRWCSILYTDDSKFKLKIFELENLLLDMAEVTPTKRMAIINNIRSNDSLKIEAYPTYGLRLLDAEYEFDKIPMKKNKDGIGI